MQNQCVFCEIAAGKERGHVVFENETTIAFLDIHPVFLGHCLVIPKTHVETFNELPSDLINSLFSSAQKIAIAIEKGLSAGGSFIGMNTKISQSVPHVHVHIVPRNKGDGLRGFFWPRQKYLNEEQIQEIKNNIIKFLG